MLDLLPCACLTFLPHFSHPVFEVLPFVFAIGFFLLVAHGIDPIRRRPDEIAIEESLCVSEGNEFLVIGVPAERRPDCTISSRLQS